MIEGIIADPEVLEEEFILRTFRAGRFRRKS